MSSTARTVQRRRESFSADSPLSFLWLEITGKCNLKCVHCYADSSPVGEHSVLTVTEWKTIIADAYALGARTVQFIGGEPTIYPDFLELVRYAATMGLAVEVYTNLIRVSRTMWSVFEECSVSLATSFYSHDADVHERVTNRVGSQRRTLQNIQEALRRQLPLRVGIIKVFDEQDVTETIDMLRGLGVEDVGVDNVRGIGRGAAVNAPARPVDALCGSCGTTNAAIDPYGWVYPCVFSRWLKAGNVRTAGLKDIYKGLAMMQVKEELNAEFALRGARSAAMLCRPDDPCYPETCRPGEPCNPDSCRPVEPCNPESCRPSEPCAPESCRPFEPCNPDTCRPSEPCNPDLCRPDR